MAKPMYNVGRAFRTPFRWVSSSISNLKKFVREEPTENSLADVVSDSKQLLEGMMYHIDALRKHLLRIVAAMILTTGFSFAFTRQIIDYLALPIGGIQSLTAIEVTEPISVFMRVALLSGFTLALPYIAFEIWLFVAPALSVRSRIMGLLALPAVLLFFVGGAAFAYYIMMPVALPFLIGFMDMTTQVRPSSYIKFVTSMLFWIGMVFEFPLVIYVLAGMGLVRAKNLIDQWRLAVVIIAVIAALITPTVDPITMGVVMAPMILLYFFSILLAKFAQRKRT